MISDAMVGRAPPPDMGGGGRLICGAPGTGEPLCQCQVRRTPAFLCGTQNFSLRTDGPQHGRVYP